MREDRGRWEGVEVMNRVVLVAADAVDEVVDVSEAEGALHSSP